MVFEYLNPFFPKDVGPNLLMKLPAIFINFNLILIHSSIKFDQ